MNEPCDDGLIVWFVRVFSQLRAWFIANFVARLITHFLILAGTEHTNTAILLVNSLGAVACKAV